MTGAGLEGRPGYGFTRTARDGEARCGRLTTPHGVVETPAFMSVATFGAVRGVGFEELEALGAQILLANTYHLHERPGEQVVAAHGGLQGFTGWRGPWLTDSGGYQVFSLAERMRIDEEGITFASPLDGKRRLLTPEGVVGIQEALGSDIAMVLDECQPAVATRGAESDQTLRVRVEAATERTLRWAERSHAARRRPGQALFGIVQGGLSPSLRARAAAITAEIGFDGYAHGGLGLGEERALRAELVAAVHAALPEAAPRYLMGLGQPVDLVDGIAGGVDLFDCVVPTRNARHGVVFTRQGLIHLRNARFRDDTRPLDPDCACPCCARHSRAYLRHLLQAGEALGARLATVHNLHFYLGLMREARTAIAEGRLGALREHVTALAGQRAP